MTVEKFIEIFKREYEDAKALNFVRKPMAYAAYQAWKYVNKHENERKEINDEEGSVIRSDKASY